MGQWNAAGINGGVSGETHRQVEARAHSDAHEVVKRLYRDGIPGGRLEPVAIEATHAYVARLRQESAGFPAWVLRSGSPEIMRQYLQSIGDRYYFAFLRALGEAVARNIVCTYTVPRTTPLPRRSSSSSASGPRMMTENNDDREQREGA
jgi:hypothetical protein